ncbi:protein extra-macrochaetae [Anopheles gambiae]|uniref:protein extra-macrochaetae n=1 Tax=Anopheles coluzzii TaxID=1518534 RepID=UPI0020FFF1DF|nr:protein extra-macrochaetae [Anopheles coluzzii]XP_061519362.1 protein extra-macrochaetae [Anopheles gambiae]XP_061519363.1 protein extra-macrochaetae [Anopheles gambiae]
MKAITTMCAKNGGGASLPAIATGRVQRHRDGENDEIKLYLSKLRELVPFMPKNRKLSKLEVIQNVIDYICELQNALDSHPAVNSFDSLAVLQQHQQQQQQQQQQVGYMVESIDTVPAHPAAAASRQPLATILSSGSNVAASNINAIGEGLQQP